MRGDNCSRIANERGEPGSGLGGLGPFRAARQREQAGNACGGRGRGGAQGLVSWLGWRGSFGSGGRARRLRCRIHCGFCIWVLDDADETLVGNLPAEVLVLAVLLKVLFKENGAAGIGDEYPGSRQENIASAVLHFHTTAEKG